MGNGGIPALPLGGLLPLAIRVPDHPPGIGLELLAPVHQLREPALGLEGLQVVPGLEQGIEQGLLHIAGTHHPGGDPVDGGVKIIQADQHLMGCIVADDLLGDLHQLVIQQHHMVAIPADAPGHMEGDPVEVAQQAGDLIADHLGGVVMAVVQQVVDPGMGGRVGDIKFAGSHRVGLQANAEHLGFHAVHHPGQLFCKDLIQAILEPEPRGHAVGGYVLVAVGHPYVAGTVGVQLPGEIGGDPAAGDAVADPEAANVLVGAAEGQAIPRIPPLKPRSP